MIDGGRTQRGAPAVRWLFGLSGRPEVARMNQCPTCNADPHQLCYGRTFSRRRTVNHSERKAFAIVIARAAISAHRDYVDALNTPYGPLASSPACEHCDGEMSAWVRQDAHRGWTCPVCDDALDAMFTGTCDKCEGENDRANESNYCSRCGAEYQERIALDPETQPVGTP